MPAGFLLDFRYTREVHELAPDADALMIVTKREEFRDLD